MNGRIRRSTRGKAVPTLFALAYTGPIPLSRLSKIISNYFDEYSPETLRTLLRRDVMPYLKTLKLVEIKNTGKRGAKLYGLTRHGLSLVLDALNAAFYQFPIFSIYSRAYVIEKYDAAYSGLLSMIHYLTDYTLVDEIEDFADHIYNDERCYYTRRGAPEVMKPTCVYKAFEPENVPRLLDHLYFTIAPDLVIKTLSEHENLKIHIDPGDPLRLWCVKTLSDVLTLRDPQTGDFLATTFSPIVDIPELESIYASTIEQLGIKAKQAILYTFKSLMYNYIRIMEGVMEPILDVLRQKSFIRYPENFEELYTQALENLYLIRQQLSEISIVSLENQER